MIGIVQDWLFSKLGIYFNLDKLEENNSFQNGSVFFKILMKYGLVNSNFAESLAKGYELEACMKNMKLLKPMFDMLSVGVDEDVILDVVKNNKFTILKILYELYVCLENKQQLYFVTQNEFGNILKNHIKCLNKKNIFVKQVNTEKNTIDPDICFKQPLVNNRDLVEWYKKRYKVIEKNMKSRLSKMEENLNNETIETYHRTSNQKKKHSCPCSCKSDKFKEELIASLPDMDMFNKDNKNENLFNYNQFIAYYRTKQKQKSAKQRFENNIQKELLQRTWDKIMEKQNEIYNSIFSEIMLKQSQYEKQILAKLFQTQSQIKIENENKISIHSKVVEEEINQINSDFKLKEEFEELEKSFADEQARILELHRKLYKQKQALIKKNHNKLCADVLESLIDIAVNVSEYQSKYRVAVPKVLWNSWKQYFYKSQSIHIPFQTLEREVSAGEVINYDDIIDFEKESSAAVNENDVNEYLYTCGKWFFEDICKTFGDINEKNLAFVVYRLLSLKYPPPPSPLPAQLPPFSVAAVLLDFYNDDCIEKLKILLSKPLIHVFDCEAAIKKSISKFEEETTLNTDVKAVKKSKEAKSPKVLSKIKGGSTTPKNDKKKNKTGKKNNHEPMTENIMDEILVNDDLEERKLINLIDKETQTSIIKDDQKLNQAMERSALGLIGEKVFNVLKDGQKIEDALLVNVLIEYLKTLQDYDGWVLLNYPTTIDQAAIFELALSGKRLPIEDYTDDNDEFQNQVCGKETDEYEPKRKSKLLLEPNNENNVPSFKTYFTVFIKNKHISETDEPLLDKDKTVDDMIQNDEYSDESSSSNKEKISLDVLETIYTDQNVYNNFYYVSNDIVELKKLARLIIKEDSRGEKDSVDIFGKEALDKLSKGFKKKKKDSNSGKSKSVEKGKNKKKQVQSAETVEAEHENLYPDNNAFEFVQNSLETDKTNNTLKESLQVKSVTPGDEDWQFVSLPLSGEMAVILATMWENLENCYLQNLEDICFENRMINLRLVPYSTFVKETVEKIASKPDMRQDLVNRFHDYFMAIDDDLRVLPEVKNHLFCKVLEMQQNLWQIIDIKKNEVEAKRQELILENWLINELCMLINNYFSLIQTEFNRSIDTLILVSDYYLNMLEKPPSVANATHIMNFKVSKVTADDFLSGNLEILSNNNDSKHMSVSSRPSDQQDETNFIARSLIDCTETDKVIGIIHSFIPREVECTLTAFQSLTLNFCSQIKTEEELLVATNKKLAKEKNINSKGNKKLSNENEKSKSKKNLHSEKKVEKKQTKDSLQTKDTTGHDLEVSNLQKESLMDEWKFVVDSEIERFNLRMNLICLRSHEDIMEFYCYVESVFCELLNANLSEYQTDINNTDKLCDYLRTTIEEESSLIYPLVLRRSKFFVDISQKPTKEYSEIKELFEQVHEYVFSVNQLRKLLSVFKIAGPHGVIRKQPFCYILEDLMLFNDTDNQPHLPKAWSLLDEHQLLSILGGMFGLEYAINWRDFLIYNMCIPFPSCDEILSMRKQFIANDPKTTEVISIAAYNETKLWFEQDLPRDPQEGLRFALIKDLLSDMFKVDEQKINYTALLLHFCKDYDPVIGFKKALCLSVGKYVVTSKEELDKILEEEFEIKKSVMSMLDNIINTIVVHKEGTLIYEVFESISAVSTGEEEPNYTVSDGSVSRSESFGSEEVVINETKSFENEPENENKSTSEILKPLQFDSSDTNKAWVSKIPITAVISVLNASFLHQDKTFLLRNLYLNCLEKESKEDGMVEAHVLVALDCMNKLFNLTNKFKACIPFEVIEKCLKKEEPSTVTQFRYSC